jgi:hypothetical protein
MCRTACNCQWPLARGQTKSTSNPATGVAGMCPVAARICRRRPATWSRAGQHLAVHKLHRSLGNPGTRVGRTGDPDRETSRAEGETAGAANELPPGRAPTRRLMDQRPSRRCGRVARQFFSGRAPVGYSVAVALCRGRLLYLWRFGLQPVNGRHYLATLPIDLTGPLQAGERWAAETNPLSRSFRPSIHRHVLQERGGYVRKGEKALGAKRPAAAQSREPKDRASSRRCRQSPTRRGTFATEGGGTFATSRTNPARCNRAATFPHTRTSRCVRLSRGEILIPSG